MKIILPRKRKDDFALDYSNSSNPEEVGLPMISYLNSYITAT